MGESAGANLATVTALRARTRRSPSRPSAALSTIDPEASTPSRQEFAQGQFLTAAASERFWSDYLGSSEITWLAVPSRATSLEDVAPALVITVELDPTRDPSRPPVFPPSRNRSTG